MSYEAGLFFQNAQTFILISKMQKEIGKMFLVLEINAFEGVAVTYLYYDENSCDRQSTSYQTVLRSEI